MRIYYRKVGKKGTVCILNVEYVKVMENPRSAYSPGVSNDSWTFVEGSSGQVAMALKRRDDCEEARRRAMKDGKYADFSTL